MPPKRANLRYRLSWQEKLCLLLVLWLAFALRVYRLDAASLWLDEGINLHRAQLDLPDLLQGEILAGEAALTDRTPPLYYLWLAGVRAVGGESVFALRLASVWAGVISAPLIFVLGRRLFGKGGGLAAAFFCAASPYWVWYTQAVRPDALVITLALLSVLALQRILARRHRSFFAGLWWLSAAAVLVYTHSAGLWVVAFEVLALSAVMLRRRIPAGWLVAVGLMVLVTGPIIGRLVDMPSPLETERPAWHEARALAHPVGLGSPTASGLSAVLECTDATCQERGSFGAAAIRLVPTAVLGLASLVWLFRVPRRVGSWLLVAGYLLIPILLLQAVTAWTPLRVGAGYLALALAPAYLLMGSGALALWQRWRAVAVAVVLGVTAVMGYWLGIQYGDPLFQKDDLRLVAAYVSENARAGDVVVLSDPLVQFTWYYYYDGLAQVETIPSTVATGPEEAVSRFDTIGRTHDRVWFLRRPEPGDAARADLLSGYADGRWIKFDERAFSSRWLAVELEGYMVSPPLVEALPPAATLTQLCWPGGLCLHGWSAEKLTVGSDGRVTLYWSKTASVDGDYGLLLTLRDEAGLSWSEQSGPLFRFYPVSRWPTGVLLSQEVTIPLSPALPPARFSLGLTLQKLPDSQLLVSSIGSEQVVLGDVILARPETPIDPTVLSLQYHSGADFGPVRLLGYNLPLDTPRPGHFAFVDFYWQVLATPDADWQQRTRLVDRDGVVWLERTSPLTVPEFPASGWQPGDLVWGRVPLFLPGQMPGGEYAVEVTLLDPAGDPVPAKEIWRAEAAESVVVGPAYVDPWPLLTEPPPMPHRPDVILGDAIRLWGYEIVREPRPGGTLEVTLVWRDEIIVDKDYHVFIHLMDGEERLLGQSDGVPAFWTRPTTTWRPGEYVVDQHTVPVAADAPAGPIYLWVGLYLPDGSGRLTVSNPEPGRPDDRVLLDILVVGK